MPSPFPGMNPYLEQPSVWVDFHQSFIPAIRRQLSAQVRPKYLVKIEEQLFIREAEGEHRRLLGRGDVVVSGTSPESGAPAATLSAPATARLPQNVDVEPHAFLEVRDRDSGTLVTVIELLSPANKQRGPDRGQYLAKRRQVLASDAHLVEIDLLRGGPKMPLDDLPDCDYLVTVSRQPSRPDVDIWPLGLSDELPTIPIPLRPGDEDAKVDLQATLHEVYDAAGYADYIYQNAPSPPLNDEQSVWAKSLTKAK